MKPVSLKLSQKPLFVQMEFVSGTFGDMVEEDCVKILEMEISCRGSPLKDSSVLRDCDPVASRSLSPDSVDQVRRSGVLESNEVSPIAGGDEIVPPSPVPETSSKTRSIPRKTKPHDTACFLSDSSDDFMSVLLLTGDVTSVREVSPNLSPSRE